LNRTQLALIGFMASGKTTLGPRLATRMRRPFLDLDMQIEIDAGRRVAEIFADEGEEGFREREERILRASLMGPPAVIATGGGVLERDVNRALLREHAFVVWLDPPFEVIRRRLLAATPGERPLYDRLGLLGLRELLQRRRPAYAATADMRVHAHAMPVARLARELARDLREMLEGAEA